MYYVNTKKDSPTPPVSPEDAERWEHYWWETYGEIA